MRGEIPADIIDLARLSNLDLSHNQLSGEVPDLSTMSSLAALTLSHNQLSGEIPALPGGFGSSLAVLHLDNNRFSGAIPRGLGTTSSLIDLWLQNNQLTGTIPDMYLRSLTTLRLSNNQLSGGIPNLSQLTSLTDLRLHNNQLSGSLTNLSPLTLLEELSLYDNPRGSASALYGYPSEMNSWDTLSLIVPNTPSYPMCLPSTMGGNDCTIPTKVDQLRLWPLNAEATGVAFKIPAPAPSGYEMQYRLSSATTWSSSSIHGDEIRSNWDPGHRLPRPGVGPRTVVRCPGPPD